MIWKEEDALRMCGWMTGWMCLSVVIDFQCVVVVVASLASLLL